MKNSKNQTRLFITMSPERGNDTPLTYNRGIVTAVISLGRSHQLTGNCTFTLYNDEQMMLDYGNTDIGNVERRGRSIKLTITGVDVWLPGEYFLLVRDNEDTVLRFDFTLDEHATFHPQEPTTCGFLSLEDILSNGVTTHERYWQWMSMRPGLRQFRQKSIERVRLAKMNDFRSKLIPVEGISTNNNFIIASQGYTMVSQSVLLFRSVAKLGGEFKWIDCAELYDATNNNPYEKLQEVFSGETSSDNPLKLELSTGVSRTYCLENIGALMDSNGKIILKKLRHHWSNVILTGTQQEIDNLLEQYPSLRELFPAENHITIEPFTAKEIIFWLFTRTIRSHLYLSPEAIDKVCRIIMEAHQQGTISQWSLNDISDYIERHIRPHYCQRLTSRIQGAKVDLTDIEVLPDDIDETPLFQQATTYDNALQELDGMIGLGNIKRSLTTIANNMHLHVERQQLGLHTSGKTAHHAIFMGNPGTGKTTVARLLGKIYHSLGLLTKGDVVCVDRTRIIGRYIGETEENMKQILQEARGNVLFVDEAYTLYSQRDCNDFGRRAVECLLNVLTQKNPDMLIIFAGYQDEMDKLMSMNPGLVGRFPYKFLFKDYSADELMQIAETLLARDEYQLTEEAAALLLQTIRDTVAQKNKNFGNARWIEQYVLSGIIPALADRLASTPHPFTREVYQRIEVGDIQRAYEKFNPRTIELKPHRQVGFSA